MSKAKGSKKNRKVGRSKIACQAYSNSNRREHNKARRLKKHMAKWPNDKCATAALARVHLVIRPGLAA